MSIHIDIYREISGEGRGGVRIPAINMNILMRVGGIYKDKGCGHCE